MGLFSIFYTDAVNMEADTVAALAMTVSTPLQHRRPRQSKMPEQLDHLGESLLTVGIDV